MGLLIIAFVLLVGAVATHAVYTFLLDKPEQTTQITPARPETTAAEQPSPTPTSIEQSVPEDAATAFAVETICTDSDIEAMTAELYAPSFTESSRLDVYEGVDESIPAPQNVVVTPGLSWSEIEWDPVPGADKYAIVVTGTDYPGLYEMPRFTDEPHAWISLSIDLPEDVTATITTVSGNMFGASTEVPLATGVGAPHVVQLFGEDPIAWSLCLSTHPSYHRFSFTFTYAAFITSADNVELIRTLASVSEPYAYKLFLTDPDHLDPRLADVFLDGRPSMFTIIGDETVVSTQVETELEQLGASTRRWDTNRSLETESMLMSKACHDDCSRFIVVNRDRPGDIFVASHLAGEMDAHVVTVTRDEIPPESSYGVFAGTTAYAVGGVDAFSDDLIAELEERSQSPVVRIAAEARNITETSVLSSDWLYTHGPEHGVDYYSPTALLVVPSDSPQAQALGAFTTPRDDTALIIVEPGTVPDVSSFRGRASGIVVVGEVDSLDQIVEQLTIR